MIRHLFLALAVSGLFVASPGAAFGAEEQASPTPPSGLCAGSWSAAGDFDPTGQYSAPIGPPVVIDIPDAKKPPASDWGRVPFEAGLRDPHGASWIESIAAGPRGIVAIGRAPTGAAAWFSVDGLSWERAVPPRSWTTRGQFGWFPTFRDVVATDDGFVVVGIEHDGPKRYGGNTGSVWTSPDGLIWRRSARGVGPYLTDLIEYQGDLYAVSGGVHKRTTPAIWRSDDGRAWQRVYTAPEGSGIAVIASDGNVIVAGDGFTMLVSTDGQTWEPASIEPLRRGGDDDLYDATAFDDGFIAVGQRERNAAVWLSKDGRSWDAVPETIPTGGYITHFHAVASTPDGGLVAVANNDLYEAYIYGSDDGHAWELVLELDGLDLDYTDFALAGATSTNGWVFVAGFDRDAPRGVSAAVWTSPSPMMVAPDGLASTACPGHRPTLTELLEMEPASRVECFGAPLPASRARVLSATVRRHGCAGRQVRRSRHAAARE